VKNAKFRSHDVKRRCESKLAIVFRAAKEFNGWYLLDGRKAARVTVPIGRKPLTRGTYCSMARQLKLGVQEFDELLECPLDGKTYAALLRQRIEPPRPPL
jgi:hypothetical protein